MPAATESPHPSAEFAAMGDKKFVSLTTFRKSGIPVSTPVWIGHDGDALVVTTPTGSGKVKRIRNSPRVELRACSRTGRVADDAVCIEGIAEIRTDDASRDRLTRNFVRKYGFEYRILMFIERRGKSPGGDRVLLRITPAD